MLFSSKSFLHISHAGSALLSLLCKREFKNTFSGRVPNETVGRYWEGVNYGFLRRTFYSDF